jgi:hypothetical protein
MMGQSIHNRMMIASADIQYIGGGKKKPTRARGLKAGENDSSSSLAAHKLQDEAFVF